MAEFEDHITYKIRVDPSEAQREAQKALENEKAKGAAPGRPSSGPASHFTAPIDQPVQTAAEQEREKMRVHRLSSVAERIVTAPSMADRIVTSASGGTPISVGKTQNTAARLTSTPAAQNAAAKPPPIPATPGAFAQALNAVKPFISHVVPRGYVETAHRLFGQIGAAQTANVAAGAFAKAAPIALPALGGAAAAPAGGGLAGLGLGAGATAGIAALVALSVANVASSFKHMTGGASNMATGAMTGNGSQILKGYISTVGGALALPLGPLGLVVNKVTDEFTKLVDVADSLVSRFARFNAQIAVSLAQLQVKQIQSNIRVAQAQAPFLSEYNKLKGNLVDIGSKFAVAGAKFDSFIITPLEKVANKILNWLHLGDDADSGFGGKNVADRFNAWQMPGGPNVRAATSGVLPNIAGNVAHIGQIDQDKKAYAQQIPSLQRDLADLQKSQSNPYMSPEQKAHDQKTMSNIQARINELKGRLSSMNMPGIGVPASPGMMKNRPPAEAMPQSPQTGAETQPRITAKGPTPPSSPLSNLDIRQTINLNMESKITHEQQVHESVMQIRDELVRVFRTAQDEARLAISMLNLGSAMGVI